MRAAHWTRVLAAAALAGVSLMPADAWAQGNGIGRGRATAPGQIKKQQNRDEYYRGYQQGLREGQNDARRNRPYQSAVSNNGRRTQDVEFRNGYADGYRDGYSQVRGDRRDDRRPNATYPRDERRQSGIYIPSPDRNGGILRRTPGGGYQEPAFARGYSDGYEDGLNDGRDRHKYDPVGEKDYRNADKGYYKEYGSKEAYKNNFRAGFRQGYEDGYRQSGARR